MVRPLATTGDQPRTTDASSNLEEACARRNELDTFKPNLTRAEPPHTLWGRVAPQHNWLNPILPFASCCYPNACKLTAIRAEAIGPSGKWAGATKL